MYLKKLFLTHFKNYATQALDLSPGLNCFVGKNGMGKTNLLDAIYYMCMCKSNFGQGNQYLVQHDAEFMRLEGNFELNGKNEKIVAKLIPGKSKHFERNDVPYEKISEHIGLLPVVMIIPDDTLLIMGGSEERRRFLDNTLSQIDQQYLSNLLQYNRALRQRNAALKQFGRKGGFQQSLIDAYNLQMAEPARLIHEKRAAFIEAFVPVFRQFYAVISKGQEEVNLKYRSQLLKQDFESLVKAMSEKDRILQRSNGGIHKDDLVFQLGDLTLKRFASQGQLKSYVLGLKLAQYDFLRKQKNISPILLLDDIFDKLDRQRVRQLVGLLAEQNFGQVCITDTHDSRLEEIVSKFDSQFRQFYVDSGQAVRQFTDTNS